MEKYLSFIKSDYFKRIMVVLIIVLFLFLFKSILNVLLLTMIFTILAYRLFLLLKKYLKLPDQVIIVLIYATVILIMYLLVNNFVNEIAQQTSKVTQIVDEFYKSKPSNFFVNWVLSILNELQIEKYLTSLPDLAVSYARNIGSIGLAVFMSFLLSFFFLIDLKNLTEFGSYFMKSRFKWFWKEVAFVTKKFVTTFGVVLETQFIISLFNTIVTTFALYLLNFPQLLSLAILIFILGLIPVAGVFISCIPLTIIAYTIGGIQTVLLVLVLIVIIHAIEAYLLNPNLMSKKTKLPIFVVFLVLFIAEGFLKAWGLIVGIPIFVFLLDLLEIKQIEYSKKDTSK